MKREFLQNLMDMPKEVVDAIMAEHGRDLQALRQSAQDWEGRYHAARLDAAVGQAITAARGRNQKAITALLDAEALKSAEDMDAAAKAAVEAVKKECGYLFEAAMAPGFAPGTGAVHPDDADEPQTLAGALREKFGK